MEWILREVRQVNGEWYQCLKSASCDECAFLNDDCISISNLKCSARARKDRCSVIFKKLEKVGEPFACRNMSLGRYGIIVQRYKVSAEPIFTDNSIKWCDSTNETILIALNNEEYTEEKKVKSH